MQPNPWTKRIVVILFALLCFASVAVSVYFYLQNKNLIANPQAAVEKETQVMLKRISSVMELPAEKPSVITVVDREKLQDQEFFRKAANGDRIIIYETTRRIILYRPGTGKVIDVAPLVYNTPKPDNANVIGVEEQATTPFPVNFGQ